MMKKIIMLLISCVLLTGDLYAGDLDKPYTPTRREWLVESISSELNYRTGFWAKRYAFTILIHDDEDLVSIGFTVANSEESLNNEQQAYLIQLVKGIVRGVLDQYEWAKEMKVFVTFT